MRASAAAIAVALASSAAAQAPRPIDPVAFFTGPTRGQGELREMLARGKRTETVSFGRVDKNGWLVLNQRVMVEGDPVRQRQWRLKQVGPGKFNGTLSDARGPVEATVAGRLVRIRYKMKGNLKVEQVLTELPGGKSLENRATFFKWGMKVATLTERIDKR